MFYGAMVWDPWLIVAQIACLQCLLYLSLGVYLWLFVGSHVHHFTLRYFFDYELLSFTSFDGWCTIVSFLMNYATGSLFLLFLVERTKKCLDFAATAFMLHLFLCLIFRGFPTTLAYWIVNGLGVVGMTLLGEWLCMRKEQRDIPIGIAGRAAS